MLIDEPFPTETTTCFKHEIVQLLVTPNAFIFVASFKDKKNTLPQGHFTTDITLNDDDSHTGWSLLLLRSIP